MANKSTGGVQMLADDHFHREDLPRDFDVVGSGLTVTEPADLNLDNFAGSGVTFRGKTIANLDQVKQQIDGGASINTAGKGVITYTFNNLDHLVGLYNNPTIGFGAGFGFSPFSEGQKAEARDSIVLWDDLIAPAFKETNGLGADIQFANSFDPAQAYAYFPGKPNYLFRSDVFVATPEINWTNDWLGFNGYGATTLIHELGHSLGLSHPGAYNFGPNFSATYLNGAEYAQDSEQYSIMSYWSPSETGAMVIDFSTFLFGNAQTPMLHDILTIQSKYGADPTTRTGDTVYGFNSNAKNDVFDFTKNAFPNVSIYDAGGNDTIDLSGFNRSVFLNLDDGSFSSAAQAAPSLAVINANRAALTQIAAVEDPELSGFPNAVFGPLTQTQVDNTVNTRSAFAAASILNETGVSGITALAYDNISIAYGTTIENGVGGTQRDLLWGNAVANKLEGRNGDDELDGFQGADLLLGGAGADTFAFRFIEKGDRIGDFDRAAGDRIDLRDTGVDFTWVGAAAFSGAKGELRFANGVLEADTNGDKIADLSITVTGTPVHEADLFFL